MMCSESQPEEIAERIERYLTDHPHAADSVAGITHWWLTRQRFEEGVKLVEQALEILVQRGTVGRRVQRDGQMIYERSKCPNG